MEEEQHLELFDALHIVTNEVLEIGREPFSHRRTPRGQGEQRDAAVVGGSLHCRPRDRSGSALSWSVAKNAAMSAGSSWLGSSRARKSAAIMDVRLDDASGP